MARQMHKVISQGKRHSVHSSGLSAAMSGLVSAEKKVNVFKYLKMIRFFVHLPSESEGSLICTVVLADT